MYYRTLGKLLAPTVLANALLACSGKVEQAPAADAGGSTVGAAAAAGGSTNSGGASLQGTRGGATSVGFGGTSSTTLIDKRLMGDGTSNKTNLGGYWYTFVDRSGKSRVVPDTGKVDPFDTTTIPAILKAGIGAGNGLEDGVFHVNGVVGVAPAYNDTTVYDSYWDAFYGPSGASAPGVCAATGCGEMKYPEAGLALEFKAKSAALGADARDKVGISFRMKLGSGHPSGNPVSVSVPMDLTDVPDPTFDDQFGTLYMGMSNDKNRPICTFPGTLKADGSMVGSASKTCFAHMTTEGHTVLDVGSEMKTFCLAWSRFGAPAWASSALASATPISVTDLAVLKEHSVRLRFDAYRPPSSATASAPFDFYVDDVYLLDQANWDEICTQPGVVVP